MYICYIDESGGFEAPELDRNATPLMALAGLIVRVDELADLTAAVLNLKNRYFPNLRTRRHLDLVLEEVKGASLRIALRSRGRDKQRHAIGVLESVVRLIEQHDVRLIGRVWVKAAGQALAPTASYTYAIQDMARHFNHFLGFEGATGMMLCDARRHRQDVQVAHSIFTLKHKQPGDDLPQIHEAPVFGRSENHIGLQLADIVVAGLIFPIAARVYCGDVVDSVHTHESFDLLRHRFARRLRSQLHLYQDPSGRVRGGIVVSDKRGERPSSLLLQEPEQ